MNPPTRSRLSGSSRGELKMFWAFSLSWKCFGRLVSVQNVLGVQCQLKMFWAFSLSWKCLGRLVSAENGYNVGPVWPHYRNFVIFEVCFTKFWENWKASFNNFQNLLCQTLYTFGQIYIVSNGLKLNNNLAIWLPWFPPSPWTSWRGTSCFIDKDRD